LARTPWPIASLASSGIKPLLGTLTLFCEGIVRSGSGPGDYRVCKVNGPSALTTPTDITLPDSKRDLVPVGFCRPGPLRPPDFKLQRECSIVRDFLTIKKRLVHNMQAKGLLRAVRWLLGYSG